MQPRNDSARTHVSRHYDGGSPNAVGLQLVRRSLLLRAYVQREGINPRAKAATAFRDAESTQNGKSPDFQLPSDTRLRPLLGIENSMPVLFYIEPIVSKFESIKLASP
eukprot:6176814-Pleurochrysis_carterae.AAC.2